MNVFMLSVKFYRESLKTLDFKGFCDTTCTAK